MEFNEVMTELESLGKEQTRKIYINHGADIPQFGVSISSLKKIAKKLKGNHEIGYKLLFSNNIDAMYMSQWIVDISKLTKYDLEKIIDSTNYYLLLDNLVALLAAKNKSISLDCLYDWIGNENPRYRQTAYSLYSYILGSYQNAKIDVTHVRETLTHVRKVIHNEENRVKYSMNNFVISAGSQIPELTAYSLECATEIGKVEVFMGKTACKVPHALNYIAKIDSMNNIGKKRKL